MERRFEERTATNVHLTCRVPARPCRAIMRDLSHTGCRLDVPEGNVELGGTALIDVPGAARIVGRVVWIKGTEAGIRFERPLRGPVAVALGLDEPEPELLDNPPPAPPQEPARRRGLVADRLRQLGSR